MGPTLIFDKSFLQGLSVDEAVWLDQFYGCNIIPPFFLETLADLAKDNRKGKSPEELVGDLALKTPDAGSYLNVHHRTMLSGELFHGQTIDMRYGRPITPGGRTLTLDEKIGMISDPTPEEEAFARWQNHEFQEFERGVARAWRLDTQKVSYDRIRKKYYQWFRSGQVPRTLIDTKSIADGFINGPDREGALRSGLSVIGVLREGQEVILNKWRALGEPSIKDFAPYFHHVFSVDLFFFLAIAASLVGPRKSNVMDVAYMYYLPFCMVFTSNDTLHTRTVPLFLQNHQSFVKGSDLKGDLRQIDLYYSFQAKEANEQGILGFAPTPPRHMDFLTCQLWDKSMNWRQKESQVPYVRSKFADDKLLHDLLRFEKDAIPVDQSVAINENSVHIMMMKKNILLRKGKWTRYNPPKATKTSDK